MRRVIIHIDEEKCSGCGQCVPACAEGALAVVDGKARLVSEVHCDGLGACLGECPEGALTLEEREVPAFDAQAAARHLAAGHLKEADQRTSPQTPHHHSGEGAPPATLPCGCPSSSERLLERPAAEAVAVEVPTIPSELRHWPVQLALVSPEAGFLRQSELLLAADCVPFACPEFHPRLLRGHTLLVGCPKLDDAQAYTAKLAHILARQEVRGVTVAHMEVPCCFGLVEIVRQAARRAGSTVPLRSVTVSVDGELLPDQERVRL